MVEMYHGLKGSFICEVVLGMTRWLEKWGRTMLSRCLMQCRRRTFCTVEEAVLWVFMKPILVTGRIEEHRGVLKMDSLVEVRFCTFSQVVLSENYEQKIYCLSIFAWNIWSLNRDFGGRDGSDDRLEDGALATNEQMY